MKKSINLSVLATITATLFLVVGFQNCAPPKNSAGDNPDRTASNLVVATPSPTFTFSISDPNNLVPDAAKKSLMMENLKAATQLWAAKFNSSASLHVHVDVLQNPNNRFGGSSVTKIYNGTTFNGRWVAEEGAAYKLRTGIDANGTAPDISIWVDPDYLNNEMWLDPTPYDRTNTTGRVPSNREDGVSVFMHELGHSFGFNGYFPDRNVPLPTGWIGLYDKFISVDANNKAWYSGANAVAAYGGRKIPLCIETNYHMGNIATSATDGLAYMLMTGNYFMYGHRYTIDNMTLAVLKDLGLPLK